MKLEHVSYDTLLNGENKYSIDQIISVYSDLLDSLSIFLKNFAKQIEEVYPKLNFVEHVYLDENRAIQAVLEALDDLKRLKDFHPVDNPNKIKYAAYLSYWFIQRKPLLIHNVVDISDDIKIRLDNINEYFLATYVLSQVFDRESNPHCCSNEIDKYRQEWDKISNYLFYFLCYRAISPKSIEAFLIGSVLHPIWNINDGVNLS